MFVTRFEIDLFFFLFLYYLSENLRKACGFILYIFWMKKESGNYYL